jgi:hypothetical protein
VIHPKLLARSGLRLDGDDGVAVAEAGFAERGNSALARRDGAHVRARTLVAEPVVGEVPKPQLAAGERHGDGVGHAELGLGRRGRLVRQEWPEAPRLDDHLHARGRSPGEARTQAERRIDSAVRGVAGGIALERPVHRPLEPPAIELGRQPREALGIGLAEEREEAAGGFELSRVGREPVGRELGGGHGVARSDARVQRLRHRAEVRQAAARERCDETEGVARLALVEPQEIRERGDGGEAPDGRGRVPATVVVHGPR